MLHKTHSHHDKVSEKLCLHFDFKIMKLEQNTKRPISINLILVRTNNKPAVQLNELFDGACLCHNVIQIG